jgi:uncharacterized protein
VSIGPRQYQGVVSGNTKALSAAGGMPDRVKCLHALVAHELAAGDVNPSGREALDAAGERWRPGPCVPGPCS